MVDSNATGMDDKDKGAGVVDSDDVEDEEMWWEFSELGGGGILLFVTGDRGGEEGDEIILVVGTEGRIGIVEEIGDELEDGSCVSRSL